MIHLETVPAPRPLSVAIEASVKHRCPYADEIDAGVLTINWFVSHTNLVNIEFHSLRQFLDSFETQSIGQEAVASAVVDALDAVGMTRIRVTYTGQTAGMSIRMDMP